MKHFYIIGALLCASQAVSAQDKPEVLFCGTPWQVQGISQNNKWICGGRQYAEAYRYNTETHQLEIVPPSDDIPDGSTAQEARAVMDDGTIVGLDDYGWPAIFRDADEGWEPLAVPDGFYEEGQASMATSCTSDGKYIAGYVALKPVDTPYRIMPVLWTRNDKGTYEFSELPEPETDFLGGKFQFTSPRYISEDGTRVLGPIVDSKGSSPMPLVWNKDAAGTWTCDMPMVKIKYNIDRYKEILKEEPDFNTFITKKPGESGYMAQVREFQNATAEWQYKLYSEGETGKDFSATPLLSHNGRYMAGVGADFTYSLVEDSKGQKSVSTTGSTFPAYLDLNTGEYVELTSIPDFEVVGISDDADIVTTDGYDIYLIPAADQSKAVSIADWLEEQYGFNLGEALPDNIVTNKKPRISADGRLITGVYATQTDEGELDVQETYCIKLPAAVSGIMSTLNTATDPRITVRGSQLQFSGEAAGISVLDLGGKEVLRHNGKTATLDVASLAGGVYVAKANICGKAVVSKFYISK